ncbi:MAG TPA: zinc ABC transporter substrate-binding protein, partial [Halanaerobiales bacterium]|nr:zinc ABC transporter substrate-binding protein [Halanaerobiales bacterium]
MKKRVFFSVLCLFIYFGNILFVFSLQAESYTGGKDFKIHTSFYPVYFAASNIAGERAVIESVVPNGVEVHGFEPSPQKLSEMLSADIF